MQKLQRENSFGIIVVRSTRRSLSIMSSRHQILELNFLKSELAHITEVSEFLSTPNNISNYNESIRRDDINK